MIRNVFALLLLIFCFSEHLSGQCGTDEDPGIKELIKTKPNDYQRTLIEVPVKIHIIQLSNGFGGIDSSTVVEELVKANVVYLQSDIRFYKCNAINYIANSSYTTFIKSASEDICDFHDKDGALNIYFVPDLIKVSNGDTTSLCGYAHMSDKDRVFMDNDCSENGTTLLHEIGHYLSLYHTHSTANGDELVNGSNCNYAGDGFCDTPADPKLSTSNVNTICVYTGADTDANGHNYQPDPKNLMAYGRKSCREYFSQEQMNQMSFYTTNFLSHLHCWATGMPERHDGESFQLLRDGEDYVLFLPESQKTKISAIIFDVLGRVVNQFDINNSKVSFQAKKNGPYFLMVFSEEQLLFTERFF